MPEIVEIPYLTKNSLLEANQEAIDKEFTAYCKQDALREHLKDGDKHPITAYALDIEGNFVCRILIGPYDVIFVALTQARYNSLPTAPVDMVIINALLEAAESSKH